MGGNHSADPSAEQPLQLSHPRLAGSRLVSLNGHTLIKITVPLPQKEYREWVEELVCFKKSTSKLMLPAKHHFTPAGGCGELGSTVVLRLPLQVFYPFFPYSLKDEIYDRSGKKHPFSEEELWYLLFSVSKAKMQNQPLGPLRTVSPNNIFLNQEGSIRVATSISWPQSTRKIDRCLEDCPAFFSPEEMRNMREFAWESGQLEEAGEMFSLGLTAISAGNLADYSSLYDMEERSFDQEKFLDALTAWTTNPNYSEVLRGVAANLCCHNPAKRMNSSELWGLLSKHEESIAKKIAFCIDNAPNKLHEGVRELKKLNTRFPNSKQAILQERQQALDDYFAHLHPQ